MTLKIENLRESWTYCAVHCKTGAVAANQIVPLCARLQPIHQICNIRAIELRPLSAILCTTGIKLTLEKGFLNGTTAIVDDSDLCKTSPYNICSQHSTLSILILGCGDSCNIQAVITIKPTNHTNTNPKHTKVCRIYRVPTHFTFHESRHLIVR